MSYPSGCYSHAPGLRLRALPELHASFDVMGMVYRSDRPRLFYLNLMAWLALEACPGRRPDEVEEEILSMAGPRDDVETLRARVRSALVQLEADGLVRVDGASP